MICSVTELGVGNDHSGILVLPPEIAAPGTDAREVLGLDDTIIDVNVTPDRGYAFSVRGLSRELACSFDLPFADPATAPTLRTSAGDSGPTVHLDPESGCHSVLRAGGSRYRPVGTEPVVDGQAADDVRGATDLGCRRHHELRHARTGPAPARLRRGQALR